MSRDPNRIDALPAAVLRAAVATAALALPVLSCGDAQRGASALLGSALALDAASPAPTSVELGTLHRLGLAQLWLDWGSIEATPDGPRVRRLEAPPVPAGTEAVLVLDGSWSVLRAATEQGLAALARQLVTTATEAESSGLLVPGLVLALETPALEAPDAEVVARLREGLGGRRAIGLEVARSWLGGDSETLRDVVGRADFVVAHLYGGDAADPLLFDLDALRAGMTSLAALGRPFLVGVSIVGSLMPPGKGSEPARKLSLDVLYGRQLVVAASFSFEGYVRQLLELQFLRDADLGGVRAGAGEKWSLSRPTADHLAQVLRAASELDPAGFRGVVLRSLRAADDALAVPLEELVLVLAKEPTARPLELSLELERRAGAATTVLGLANRGSATAVANVDHNLVEIVIEEGTLERVEPGGFARFELLDERGRRAALRSARTLRLYFRFLERGEVLEPARIHWSDGAPRLRATARHLSATGEVMESAPVTWPPSPASDAGEPVSATRSSGTV